MEVQNKVQFMEKQVRDQLRRQIAGIADTGFLPVRTLRLLDDNVPGLAREVVKNINLSKNYASNERISHGFLVYAEYVAKRQQRLLGRRLPNGAKLIKASSAWALKFPCCSVTLGIWPFCRSGC